MRRISHGFAGPGPASQRSEDFRRTLGLIALLVVGAIAVLGLRIAAVAANF